MDKPTIFFSHSSKDKELILPIKNKLDNITSNVMDIFMSSDGQSIPFGHNWVHKIEEGLKKAQIMFVFVTPTSINSSWIYFEAGFAYSKGIEVIPVGLGVNIGQLKPPLNLLQGFDINSYESLNNFVSIINKKFDLKFEESFILDDYSELVQKLIGQPNFFDINEIFPYANYHIQSQIQNGREVIRYDIDNYFLKIKEYLNKKNINYSIYEPSLSLGGITKSLLVNGIKFDIYGYKTEPKNNCANQDHWLSINISTINFAESFILLKDLIELANFGFEYTWLHFYFNNKYTCLKKNIEISSIISQCNDKFECTKDSLNMYRYLKGDMLFGIINVNKYDSKKSSEFVLSIAFDISKVSVEKIKDLILELQACKLIMKYK